MWYCKFDSFLVLKDFFFLIGSVVISTKLWQTQDPYLGILAPESVLLEFTILPPHAFLWNK